MTEEKDARCLLPQADLRTVLENLQRNALGLCVVVNEAQEVVGTITDGDCRRALLQGGSLETPALNVMNTRFIAVDETFSLDQIVSLMRMNGVQQVPVVDINRKFKDIVSWRSFKRDTQSRPNRALILAGGKGTRLRPLTHTVPKPMLPVGGRPMLERIVERLAANGITEISISVNYLHGKIESYFGDGSQWGCSITYLREDMELGTGGPLRLLPETREPILVMNGDLVTTIDFSALLDFHETHGHALTIGIATYAVQIPFGVVAMGNEGLVSGISEKPTYEHQVNAGLYVIDPKLIELVDQDCLFPMTELVTRAVDRGVKVGGFPIHELWDDIGQPAGYIAAQAKVTD